MSVAKNGALNSCAKLGISLFAVLLWATQNDLLAAEKPEAKTASKSVLSKDLRPPEGVDRLKQVVRSVDRGDSYRTQSGERKLLRHPEAVAIRAAEPGKASRLIADVTKAKGPLANFATREHPNGWIIFTPPDNGKASRSSDSDKSADRTAMLRANGTDLVNPVFVDPESGLMLVVTEDIIICLKDGVDPAEYFGDKWPDVRPLAGTRNQFVEHLANLQAEDVLAEINRRMDDPRVAWAEPDFLSEIVRHYTPNDILYPYQWHLNNTGQSGATVDADVDAPEAWNITQGTNAIVIAFIDDGVQTAHPDLVVNIFSNTGELVDGLDNDNNGYTNDYNGWDFYFNDNDPTPTHDDDVHGTACAGVAAATGNNATGVVGVAFRCRILPVKVFDGNSFVTDSVIASALRYAAGLTSPQPWRGADVISISLSFSQSAVFDSAIIDASTSGRNGKGSLIFAAAGNDGSGWYVFRVTNITAGTHTFRFEYKKDASLSKGLDAVWLDDLWFPGGYEQGWEGTFPPAGWTTGGNALWTQNTDPTYVRGTGTKSARSGSISHSQSTWLQGTVTVSAGDLISFSWTSTEYNYDVLNCYVDGVLNSWDPGGENSWTLGAGYPARHTNVIGVGASTDFDYRSDYSQFGAGLDLLAPSGGGNEGIYTTDRTDDDGYDSGDYTEFSGTSSATPLAAGIGALVLSKNPTLTRTEARSILLKSCDKIGGGTYSGGESGAGGTNFFYGYGRINAYKALTNTPPPAANLSPTNIILSNATVPEHYSPNMDVGSFSTQDPNPGDTFTYTLVSGPGSGDNSSFTIVSSNLRTAVTFDYEVRSNYSIRVQSTDQGGLSTQKVFTIHITNVNESPTNIILSNATIAENLPVATKIGSFATQDPDFNNTFTYEFASGAGDADNGSFSISGSNLLTAAVFNYEAKNNYSIRISSTDQGGLATEKAFTISVTDVNEVPVFSGTLSPTNTGIVLRWSSTTNKLYTIHYSTNLLTGFTALQSNIPATPAINSYTDSAVNVPVKFWKVTTDE